MLASSRTAAISNLTRSNTGCYDSSRDAAWVLSNTFRIMTMQTGFAMLEAGCVSSKNVANILIKNVVDVSVGGIVYWSVGYGLSFGKQATPYFGYGSFFVNSNDEEAMGSFYTNYVFHFSFASAATTIVSGALAERMKLTSYLIFSVFNMLIYAIPAGWAWNNVGWLRTLGFFDFAGAGVVHLSGGASALAAVIILGPRSGRFSQDRDRYCVQSPVTALMGTFILWWAWLSFNCGSTYGIQGDLWKIAANVAVVTLNGSIGGSLVGLTYTLLINWKTRVFSIPIIITSILGGLVGITGSCSVINPAEALFVGGIGGLIAILITSLMDYLRLDDPVGVVPVHLGSSIWSLAAVGLLGRNQYGLLSDGEQGLLRNGSTHLLLIQLLGTAVIAAWSAVCTAVVFISIKYTIGIRMGVEEEYLGADWIEHRVRPAQNLGQQLELAINELQLDDEQVGRIARKIVSKVFNKVNGYLPVSPLPRIHNQLTTSFAGNNIFSINDAISNHSQREEQINNGYQTNNNREVVLPIMDVEAQRGSTTC